MQTSAKFAPQSKRPRHIAIIMDGNGRWAKQRHLPRMAGHRAGLAAAKKIIEMCARESIEALTLFAFSSENWQRPAPEVGHLMELFLTTLNSEVKRLQKNNIQLRIIGDTAQLSEKLQASIASAENMTLANTGLKLIIAINYGGQWDIVAAAQRLASQVAQQTLRVEDITATTFAKALHLSDLPAPDLFIRTGGEQRISNFLLWQLAYTELYFTPVLWPDFDETAFAASLQFYATIERRFGYTSEQIKQMGTR